jgi:two-component system cell cycle sensor histidine kinase/response regulator CckA
MLQRRVLVIDDEEEVRNVTQRVLSHLGYDVTLAAGGAQGIDAWTESEAPFDVVMLDLTMPHPNGGETLRAIREMDPDARVILMSGYTEEAMRDSLGDSNPTAFLQKPYNLGALKQMLDDVISESRAS